MNSLIKKTIKHREAISFVVGLIGLIFGLFQYFYPNSEAPSLKFYVKDEINVLQISKDLDKLKIYFNNSDVKRDSLNLKIFKIRLKNEGSKSISESDFASIPFGLKISQGNLISINLKGSNSYLQENIKPLLVDSAEVHLNRCVFNENDFVDFEILLLHKINKSPEFSSLGKIAGAHEISIEKGQGEDDDLVGAIMAIVFLAAILFTFGLIVYGLGWIIESLRRWFRRRSILSYFDYPIRTLTPEQRTIVTITSQIGIRAFSRFFLMIEKTSGDFGDIYESEIRNQETVSRFKHLIKSKLYSIGKNENDITEYYSDSLFILNEVKESGLTDLDGKSISKAFMLESKEVILKFR